MLYIYGVLGALLLYFGMRFIYYALEFVFSDRPYKISKQQWYLTSLVLFAVMAVHLLLPPSHDVYIEPEISSLHKEELKQSENPTVIALSDLLSAKEKPGVNLPQKLVHKSLNRLEVWSLSRMDKLDYTVPSYGLWYLFKYLPKEFKYTGKTTDRAFAKSGMRCDIILGGTGTAAERQCILVTPVNLAVDVLDVECLTQSEQKKSGRKCLPAAAIRFPTMTIRLDRDNAEIDISRVWTSGKYLQKPGYEMLIRDERGQNVWRGLPLKIPVKLFSVQDRKILSVRLKPEGVHFALSDQFSSRGHFSGQVPSYWKIKTGQKNEAGSVKRLQGMIALGMSFVTDEIQQDFSQLYKDKILIHALQNNVRDHLFAAGGYAKCPKLYGSANIHGLADYLKLDVRGHKTVPEALVNSATERHQGLIEISSIISDSTCAERQTVLEIMASQLRSVLPEEIRYAHFQNLRREALKEKGESISPSP
ncbi:MAG: hypothetical protein ACRBBN_02625 [Methyloligellaceae bacterium]